jgi:hypothetical protein
LRKSLGGGVKPEGRYWLECRNRRNIQNPSIIAFDHGGKKEPGHFGIGQAVEQDHAGQSVQGHVRIAPEPADSSVVHQYMDFAHLLYNLLM